MRGGIFLNYLGQLRLYSLADLALLLVAVGANPRQFCGAILLHVAFLAYLESRHAHEYRAKVPEALAYVLAAAGLALFWSIGGPLYLVASYLYTKKSKSLGWVSPICRGAQTYAIVGAIAGFASPLTLLAAVLLAARNLVGDLRDVAKDSAHGTRTIPVILGMRRSLPGLHLVATVATSVVWWLTGDLQTLWLLGAVAVEISSYSLTPR